MEPPATISAPEATEPMMVTSPSGKTIDWPERTGRETTSEGVACTGVAAMAGTMGNAAARIFCRKLEAELIAIDGFYKTADDMDPELRGKPGQVWLEGETIKAATLG